MDSDILGKRFCRLVVVSQVEDYVSPSGGKHKQYMCLCDCGNYTSAFKEHLTSGRKKSCGCLRHEKGRTTHGEIHTRLCRIWGNMCNRCSNPNNPAWENYGGRGICVCNDWLKFENFRDWAVQNGYEDSLSIDRINNDSGYDPSNCRWVDTFVQANNKRNNHFVEYMGETRTIAEWAKMTGIPYKTLHHRIVSLGWSVERAFKQPIRNSNRHYN